MGASIQSGASQLINLRESGDGQHPERHKGILVGRVCTCTLLDYFVYVSPTIRKLIVSTFMKV